MRALIAAVLSVTLSGCYTSLVTPENSTVVVQASPVGSERIYRALVPVLRACYPIYAVVESTYFPEAKEGEIVIAQTAENVRVEMAKLTISAAGDGAKVTMHRQARFAKLDSALPAWVSGKDGGCPYGTRWEPPTATHNPYGPKPQ